MVCEVAPLQRMANCFHFENPKFDKLKNKLILHP